jgi:hypothetical protein
MGIETYYLEGEFTGSPRECIRTSSSVGELIVAGLERVPEAYLLRRGAYQVLPHRSLALHVIYAA